MKPTIITLIIIALFSGLVQGQKISDWRPENRTGVSAETGLLKSWPESGPKLLWSNLELAPGYSSPSFGENTVYITGTQDADDILYALSMDGKILWQTAMGRAWKGSNNPESRATPVVEGNKVYTCSGNGDIACIDATNGKIIWSYKASELNKGTFGMWGIAETPLIDGDRIYFSPGGPETAMIAINKNTGNVIWKSAPLNDKPGYASSIVVNYGGKKMVIGVSLGHIFGVDSSTGEILWKVPHGQSTDPNMRKLT
jgi:outer membrane protein assembly factor BamB